MYYLLFFLLFFSFAEAQEGGFPVEFVNQTQIASDDNIFITIKGLDVKNGTPCFIAIQSDGSGVCQPLKDDAQSSDFSFRLSDLKKRGVLLPYLASGRIYISIGQPMQFEITSGDIIDADGFKPRDPNYYTLYDKVEFSYMPNGGTWMNPTAVDFFSIPIRIEQPGSEVYQATGIAARRADAIRQIQTIFQVEDATLTKEWQKLFLTYTDRNGQTTLLRMMAPGKAMIQGVPGTHPMDEHYLDTYVDQLWEYYSTNTIGIDCSELQGAGVNLKDYVFVGQVQGNNFIFTNRSDPLNKIVIPKPSNSIPWFAGAQGVFDAPNNTPKAIIVRQLTSAFDVGLLPAADEAVVNRAYFDEQRPNFYTKNPLLPDSKTGPWFDLYSMGLHSFGNEQPIYSFAYDDALGQDGTLHDPKATKAVITIGDMSGTPIPQPLQDDRIYSVTVSIGDGSRVVYQGKALESGAQLEDIAVPLQVELNGQPASIYFDPPVVLPPFKAADGIVVEKTGEGAVTVAFPGLPR